MSTLLRSKAAVVGVSVALVVVIGAGGWFLLVGQKRSESKDVQAQIASVEADIAARRAELARPKADLHVRASDLYRLTKAMPGELDVAGVMLELSRIANRHGVTFTSISPAATADQNGYRVQPLDVVVQGRFSNVSRFLGEVRKLVTVRRKTLDVRGRLFSIDDVELGQPDTPKTFPNVKATATINAFVYTGAPTSTGVVPGGETTTPTPTTPSGNPTVAAGATP